METNFKNECLYDIMATEKWLCTFNTNFHQIKVQNHD